MNSFMKDLPDVLEQANRMGFGFQRDEGNGNGHSERVFIVEVDGKPQQLKEPQYKRLLESGRIKPMAQLEVGNLAPEPEDNVEVEDEIETGTGVETSDEYNIDIQPIVLDASPGDAPELKVEAKTESTVSTSWEDLDIEDESDLNDGIELGTDDWISNLDVEVLSDYLNYSALGFVQEVQAGCVMEKDAGEESDFHFIWGFVLNTTAEGFIELISPYMEHPVVGDLVIKLSTEEGKEWLGKVTEIVKATGEYGNPIPEEFLDDDPDQDSEFPKDEFDDE